MDQTTKKPRAERRRPDIGAVFLKEAGNTSWIAIAGFAMCQCWLALCFFAPQLFPENSSFRVYELSLAICALSLLPGVFVAKKVEEFAHRRRFIYPLCAASALGTLLVPLSVIDGRVLYPIMVLAALLTGLGSGWLFIAWYRAFCNLKDTVGFVLSVGTQSLLIYLITEIFLPPAFSPWIMVGIATALPVLSGICLTKAQAASDITSLTYGFRELTKPQLLALARLCTSMFIISFVCEFMRNGYLGGTDLLYYSDNLSLALLILKLFFSVIIVVWIAKRKRNVPPLYKASFILIATAVLFMPYLDPTLGYSLTNFGAFFFKIIVMLVAFSYCQSFKIAPILIFCTTRLTWALDLLFAYGFFEVYEHFSGLYDGLLGVVSVSLGLIIFFTYLFVMTDFSGKPAFEAAQAKKPSNAGDLEARCEYLAKTGKLSKREREVLGLIARGRSAPRIQEELSLSINTVNSHISHIYRKLGVNSRQELLDLIEVSESNAALT